MALFRKVIVRPGVYSVVTPQGRRAFPVTKGYIQELYDTNSRILSEGMHIPAPCAHKDDKGITPSILEGENDAETGNKKQWSSDINAGFWKKFEIGRGGELAGYVEVPGSEDDPSTPAGKLGKTIRETSVLVEPQWKDGKGRVWRKALRHVALVTNPVEPGQPNFEPVETSSDFALAMSFSMADEIGGYDASSSPQESEGSEDKSSKKEPGKNPGDDGKEESDEVKEDPTVEAKVAEVVSLVKEKLGFEMPSDTTCDNFVDRLRTILISFPKDEAEEDLMSLKKPKASKEKPEDSEVQQNSPIAMSDNPDNIVLLEKKTSKLLEKLLETVKATLKSRIEKAIAAGKIGKRYAENILNPQVDALVMSLDDLDENGEWEKSEVELRIEMAEELDTLLDRVSDKNPGGKIEGQPNDMTRSGETMSEAEMNAILDNVM